MRHSTQALPCKRVACDPVITQSHDFAMVFSNLERRKSALKVLKPIANSQCQ
jgi:hypothetical protein